MLNETSKYVLMPLIVGLLLLFAFFAWAGGFDDAFIDWSKAGTFIAQDNDHNAVDGIGIVTTRTYDGDTITDTTGIAAAYRLPQGCSDGAPAEFSTALGRYDCGVDGGGGGGGSVTFQNDGVTLTNTATLDFDQGLLAIDSGSKVVVRAQLTGSTLTDDAVPLGNASGVVAFATLPDCDTTTGDRALAYDADINSFECNIITEVVLRVRNESGSAMSAGDVVYISGFNVGQDRPLVSLADADASSTMPAVGLILDASVANNANGEVVLEGRFDDVDTSGCSVGDGVYVSTTAGAFTCTKPSGLDDQIQRIGTVLRVSATLGKIEITGAGRSNDLPQFSADDSIWLASATGVPTETAIPDCNTNNRDRLQYDTGTNAFACDSDTLGTADITDGTIAEADLNATAPTDEQCLTYENGGGADLAWQACESITAGRSLTRTADDIAADVELYSVLCTVTISFIATQTSDAPGFDTNDVLGACFTHDAVALTITDFQCVTNVGSASVTMDEVTQTGFYGSGTAVDPTSQCTTSGRSGGLDESFTNSAIAAGSGVRFTVGTATNDMFVTVFLGATKDD